MHLLFVWCGKRDLNPYGVNHTPLKRARLPVPPLPHSSFLDDFMIILQSANFVNSFLKKTLKIIKLILGAEKTAPK